MTNLNDPFREGGRKLAFVTRRQGLSDGTFRVQVMSRGDGKLESDWETVQVGTEEECKRFELNVHSEIDPGMLGSVNPLKPRRRLEL